MLGNCSLHGLICKSRRLSDAFVTYHFNEFRKLKYQRSANRKLSLWHIIRQTCVTEVFSFYYFVLYIFSNMYKHTFNWCIVVQLRSTKSALYKQYSSNFLRLNPLSWHIWIFLSKKLFKKFRDGLLVLTLYHNYDHTTKMCCLIFACVIVITTRWIIAVFH